MADGRTARAERVREQRRRQILDSSLRVFSERGYWNTSITDLVRAAGVARGTFYLYFDSKSAIFLDLLEELLVRVRRAVTGVNPSTGASVEAQLEIVVHQLLETLSQNQHLTRIVFREAVGLDASVEGRLREFNDELRGYLVHTLRLGERFGVVRSELDYDTVAACMLGSVRGVVQRYVVERDEDFDPASVAVATVGFALHGVATPG